MPTARVEPSRAKVIFFIVKPHNLNQLGTVLSAVAGVVNIGGSRNGNEHHL